MKRTIATTLTALLMTTCASSGGCPSHMMSCAGLCVDLMTDQYNCGGCGIVCDEGQVCESGVCVLTCGEGQMACDGVCRDVTRDTSHCGACNTPCAPGMICFGGVCEPDCPEGYENCSDVCRNLDSDPSHCGACGTVCAPGEVCLDGVCSFTCPSPYVDCSGSCADLGSDHDNCGTCGTVCAAGEICSDGLCVTSCYEGLTMCTGVCVDLMRDPENCGACAATCASGEVCYDGTCTASCPGGFTDCSGSCRDLDSDRLNCGACDGACADGEVCESGTCAPMCIAPNVECSGVCTNTSYDPDNCGSCGTRCSSGEACVDGSCAGLTARNVLVYYQSFSTGSEPAENAAGLLGWTVSASSSGTTFASGYDSGTYDIIVIDAPGTSLPTDVRSRVLDAISTGRSLIFSWWDLDSDSSLASSLGVTTTSFSTPRDIYPTSGASVNFFTSGASVPVPLTSSHDAGDNGDLLTLTGSGEIVCSADSSTGPGIVAITHSGNVIVLGFLPWDFQDTDDDSDTVPDMTEMFMNLLQY